MQADPPEPLGLALGAQQTTTGIQAFERTVGVRVQPAGVSSTNGWPERWQWSETLASGNPRRKGIVDPRTQSPDQLAAPGSPGRRGSRLSFDVTTTCRLDVDVQNNGGSSKAHGV